jgi:hypothetical protein
LRRKPIERRSRPRRQRKTTLAAQGRKADRLWSLIVRARGLCEVDSTGPKHSGPLQGAHGISRRYRNTRWLPINGFCLCAAHHVYFTYRPLEWEDYIRAAWGETVYDELRRIALSQPSPTYGMAWDHLKLEAERLGLK